MTSCCVWRSIPGIWIFESHVLFSIRSGQISNYFHPHCSVAEKFILGSLKVLQISLHIAVCVLLATL